MSEDLILVPRRYVASACHALANGKTAERTLAGLREYSLGKTVDADAAQSELAALREELAETQRISQQEELRANGYATQLVAAEQRNSDLRSAVSENHEWHTLYGDDFGYKDSPLYATNIAALVE